MSGFSGVMKGGWHPKGKEGGKESWRGDFKGISQVAGWMGKAKIGDDAGASPHISRPLATLKDPASFGPPPKNINYHGPAALPTEITPTRVGLGAPLSQAEIEAANAAAQPPPVQEYEEESKKAGPSLPYRSDRTGLSTSHLPPPPVHSAISQPKPGLPPRLPARQNSTGLGTPASPPPPAYDTVISQPSQPAQSDPANGILNASAINRLGHAGVSVPGLGIGKAPTPPNAPSNPGTRDPSRSRQPGSASAGAASTFSELSSRFAARNNSASTLPTTEPTSSQPEDRPNATPTWQQSQNTLRTASNFRKDPSSVSVADARDAAQVTSSAARAANTFREKHADTFAAAGRRANAFDQKYKVKSRFESFLDKHAPLEEPQAQAQAQPQPQQHQQHQQHQQQPQQSPPIQPSPSPEIAASISRKPPPPPPPKKPTSLAGSGIAAPPVPISTKPTF